MEGTDRQRLGSHGHDVYAYGVIAPSTLIELGDDYPPSGGYAEVTNVYPSLGGEAAGSAYVLARLGVTTKLQGNRLSEDDSSLRVLDVLTAAGVDCSALRVDAHTNPITEIVIAHGSQRTVLGSYKKLISDRSWEEPSRDDIQSSRIVCVDPFFGEQSELVGRWSRETGTPYVTVDAPPDSEIAAQADVVIVSEEFASRGVAGAGPREVFTAYAAHCRGLVILTHGGERLWFGRRSAEPETFSPYPVSVRDTTGAGDSFRAGIIYAMLREYPDELLIQTAAAVSALVCQQPPGVLHSPTAEELATYLSAVT